MNRPLAMHFNEILPSLLIIRFLIAENVLNKLHLEKVQMGIAFIFLKIHLFDLASSNFVLTSPATVISSVCVQ